MNGVRELLASIIMGEYRKRAAGRYPAATALADSVIADPRIAVVDARDLYTVMSFITKDMHDALNVVQTEAFDHLDAVASDWFEYALDNEVAW